MDIHFYHTQHRDPLQTLLGDFWIGVLCLQAGFAN